MTKYMTEYRITKKGAECFRSTSIENVHHRLGSLVNQSKYAIQCRSVQLDRYGVALSDAAGRLLWSSWMDLKR